MRKKRKGQLAGLWFVLPDLAGVCCFALLPMAEVIRRSFQSAVTSQWMGLKNYREVLGNTAFRLAAANTLKFTAVCIPLLVVCSLLLAVLLQRMKQAGKLLKSAFLLPVAVPAASVVLVWKTLFHSNGLLNGLLEGMGGEKVGWMTTGAAFWVLVLSYLWKNLGYDMVLWMAGLAGIPREIYEAARVDGAGEWKCFTKITLPLSKPIVIYTTLTSFMAPWLDFIFAKVICRANSDQYTIAIGLWKMLEKEYIDNWYTCFAAGAVLISIPIAALFLYMQRYYVDGLSGAVKG